MTAPSKLHTAASSDVNAVAAARDDDGAIAAKNVATSFYAAFKKRDVAAMEAAYDPGVRFHDPLFGTLDGRHRVMEMWKTVMPAAGGKKLEGSSTIGDATRRSDGAYEVKVHWDAHYELGARHIDNESDTTLVIRNGKIVDHRDDWDLSAWTEQALPHGLGGNVLANALTAFAAHTFVEVKDVFDR